MMLRRKKDGAKSHGTIIACIIGVIAISGVCIFVTGTTVSGMKERAAVAIASTANNSTKAHVVSYSSAASSSSSASSASSAKADTSSSAASSSSSSFSSSSASASSASTLPNNAEIVGSGTRNGEKVYIVKQGDTLSYISAETGYSVDAIAHLNEIDDVDLIYTDSALRIPSGE